MFHPWGVRWGAGKFTAPPELACGRLDGGAHHGFGVRRGTPLVVVWLDGEGFSVQAFVCTFVVVHEVAGHRFVC